MLDKWREFVGNTGDASYVFNCVLMQNPMCETMMRFGFDGYISAIEERQRRELGILNRLDIDSMVIDDAQKDWIGSYSAIISKLNEVK